MDWLEYLLLLQLHALNHIFFNIEVLTQIREVAEASLLFITFLKIQY